MLDLEKARARERVWNALNPEKRRHYAREWNRKNSEKRRAISRASRERHAVEVRARYRKWAKTNPDKRAASVAARNAAKLKRTPGWADLEKIKQVYAHARVMTEMLGEPWHVDHVLPLQGRFVSGLHVHNNLQILPGEENVRKGNRFIPT